MNRAKSQLQYAFLCALFLVCACPTLSPGQQWKAEIYDKDPSYIVVTVDTRGLDENVYLSNVSVYIEFFDGDNTSLGVNDFDFTDTSLSAPYLKPGKVYKRFIKHETEQLASITPIRMVCTSGGLGVLGFQDPSKPEKLTDVLDDILSKEVKDRLGPEIKRVLLAAVNDNKSKLGDGLEKASKSLRAMGFRGDFQQIEVSTDALSGPTTILGVNPVKKKMMKKQ